MIQYNATKFPASKLTAEGRRHMIEVGLKQVLHNQAFANAAMAAKRQGLDKATDEMMQVEQQRLWLKWSKAE